MADNLASIISRATAGLDPIILNYSEQFPDPAAIAGQCNAQDASDVVATIDSIFAERMEAELSGDVNGDELDDYFREMQRYASLLPHLATRFPSQLISGLESQARSTRLFVADALGKAPTPQAVHPLQVALASESFDHIRRTMEAAIVRCQAATPKNSLWSRIRGDGA